MRDFQNWPQSQVEFPDLQLQHLRDVFDFTDKKLIQTSGFEMPLLLCYWDPCRALSKFGERKEMVWLAAKVMSKVVLTSILKWAVQCSPKCCRKDRFTTIDAPYKENV